MALVLFGKLDVVQSSRAQLSSPMDRVSEAVIRRSHHDWSQNLLRANEHVHFDIFIHTWSPDSRQLLTELWGGMLVSQAHEPARFADTSSQILAYQCQVKLINCGRAMSQLLSIDKALQLKREHELATGLLYPAVIVARHDISLLSPSELPAAFLSPRAGDVWFQMDCGRGSCQVDGDFALPKGCAIGGRLCTSSAVNGSVPGLPIDWMFGGSSAVADLMGDLVRRFHDVSREMRNTEMRFISTHNLWPVHALKAGLSVRWELPRHVTLSRMLPALGSDGARDLAQLARWRQKHDTCWQANPPGLKLKGRAEESSVHPEMRGVCPHDALLICPLREGETQCPEAPLEKMSEQNATLGVAITTHNEGESLHSENEGEALAQVAATGGARGSLAAKMASIKSDLGYPESMSTAAALKQAAADTGIEQEGTLVEQATRLLAALK